MGKKETIVALSKSLPEITDKQLDWIHNDCIKREKKEIENKTEKRRYKREYIYHYFYTKGDYQIDRVFQTHLYVTDKLRKIEEQAEEAQEVVQWIYNVKTNEVSVMQRPMKFMQSDWNTEKPLGYRNYTGESGYYDWHTGSWLSTFSGHLMPGSKFHKQLKRNGIEIKKLKELTYQRQTIRLVNTSSFNEQLMKSDKWSLASRCYSSDEERIMKIAFKHKIEIEDLSLLFDTQRMMDEFNVDWHNPIVLKDWRKQHDILVKRKEKKAKEEEKKREYERLMKEKGEIEKFETWVSKYNKLKLEGYGLTIKPLLKVEDYKEEGDAMHHCVFACGYYKKADTLILSVRDSKDKRVATVEYNTYKKEIEQIRGVNNSRPNEYDSIKYIIETHKSYIKSFNKKVKQQIAIAV